MRSPSATRFRRDSERRGGCCVVLAPSMTLVASEKLNEVVLSHSKAVDLQGLEFGQERGTSDECFECDLFKDFL